MRITQVMMSKRFGGAERAFVDLAVELARRGHQVQAICDGRFTHIDQLRGVPNLVVETVTLRFRPDFLGAARMRRLIRRFEPDLVHGHLWRGVRIAGRIARRLQIPMVTTMHIPGSPRDYRDVDGFFVLNDEQEAALRQTGRNAARIVHVPNFSRVIPVASGRQAMPSGQARPLFAALGRFDLGHKGFDLLVQAVGILRERNVDVRLRLAGQGPDQEKLEALIRASGLEQRIELVGWVEDVPAFLAQADYFVLSSRYEVFGLVVIEAMACSVPIITTRTSGPLSILNDQTAFFAQPDDATSLADAMQEAIAQPDKALARAQRALAHYRQTYYLDAVLPRIEEAYEQFARAS